MSIVDKIFNYSEDYRYKTWKIFGIKFSVVKKYNSKKINIYEEIKKHDIISFDIFDTLLIRPYVKPTDLFLHIEKLYKIERFYKNRIMAEKSARGKYIDNEEITLNQIYEEIDEKYKRFKEIETSKHTRNFIKMITEEYPNMKFDLHTNGLLLNERMLTELNIIDKLSYIQISIHASAKETYDKIVLGGGWDTLMKNLEFVSNLKKQNKVENIFLFFVVSKVNLGDAKEFVNLSKKYSAECFFWNLRDWGTQYTKNEMPDEYKIYKVFKDDIFGDKIVHLNPYLSNIRNNENFLEDYFIIEIKELKDKINCYDKEIRNLNCKIDKVVDSLAWWIPIKKLRSRFREKITIVIQ